MQHLPQPPDAEALPAWLPDVRHHDDDPAPPDEGGEPAPVTDGAAWAPDDAFLATYGIERADIDAVSGADAPPGFGAPLLLALRACAADDVATRDLMASTSDAEWEAFLASLDPKTSRHGDEPMLARAEMIRSTGMDFDEMAGTQREFMEAREGELGESVGEQMANQDGKRPHGGKIPDEWGDATPKQRRRWNKQAKHAIEAVKAAAPPEMQEMLRGQQIIWDPAGIGHAFASSHPDGMHVGVAWLLAAQADPASVFSEFAHELLGHPGYADPGDFEGDYLAGPIMNRVRDGLTPAEQHAAKRTNWTLGYSYMETEIFAELLEWTYDSPTSASDHPFARDPQGRDVQKAKQRSDEVPKHLQLIHDSFAPTIAEGIVRGLWLRVQRERQILPAAKNRFHNAVHDIFDLEL